MNQFYLIQRGTFKETGNSIIGSNKIVSFDYMGYAEFECNAISKAYRRFMYHFPEYAIFHTGIYTPSQEELLVFCRRDFAEKILQSISQFIKNPYHLKTYSELEKVPIAEKDAPYNYRRSNFWWCIDTELYGDWIAFLQPHLQQFMDAVKNDYQNWWQVKSRRQRNKEYKASLPW